MTILTKEEFLLKDWHFKSLIRQDALFIYPTDTIYGIGCNASSEAAVEKLRSVKSRYTRPFSVIPPSKEWILENCIIDEKAEQWLKKLPGPYTLILNLKDSSAVAKSTIKGLRTIGVRIPEHWLTKHLQSSGVPIVTTSANLIGDNHMKNIDDIHPQIKNKVSFIIYEGEKRANPSTLVDLTESEEKLIER